MNEKYQKLNRLYNETLPRICSSPQEYNRFLQTAAFNFRMSFNNAVAAYAQNIGSDLLLSYNQWQLYGRVPRRYSKQILLYDNANKGRYAIAYPYSATVEDKRIASHKEMSFFAHENNEAVLKAVQRIYGSDETSLQRIFYSEVMEQMEAIVSEDFLAVNNAADYLSKSVVNMLLSRFGVEMPYAALPPSISAEQLQTAFRAAMDVFRAASNGDEGAAEIVDQGVRALGTALKAMIYLVDPEKIVLYGTAFEDSYYLSRLTSELREGVDSRHHVVIEKSRYNLQLEEKAAGLLAVERFFEGGGILE